MMRTPDTLPMHLLLAMMQSGILPNGFTPWSTASLPFMPDWMRPKTPLEKMSEQVVGVWEKANEQWSGVASQLLKNPFGESAPPPAPNPWANFNPFGASQSEQKNNKNDAPEAAFNPFSWFQPSVPQTEPEATPEPEPAKNPFTEFLHPDFLQTLGAEAYNKSTGFLQGLQAYATSDYERAPQEYDVLWQRGNAHLLDLAPDRRDAVAVLCIPSLINNSTILDLYPGNSFVEHLKNEGMRPLILDWGTPDEDEQEFSTADYITGYAIQALQTLRENHDGPIALVGYCMGGLFTLAMAQLAPLFVDALVLLATPWDYSAPDTPRVLIDAPTQLLFRQWIASQNPVPPLVTQTIFHMINPWRVQEKYSRYPSLSDAEKQHFLAVEQWVNDGIPLARRVAEECFVDWPHANILANHQWKVGRRWIEPASITIPTLAVIPTRDLIVPVSCALPLTEALPRCDVLMPESGHVSMLVGRNARTLVWGPVVEWLKARF